MDQLTLVSFSLLLLGVLLIALAMRFRFRWGLGVGKTLALDDKTLYSERYRLVGRPDRLVQVGNLVIPEEWKSSKRVNQGHRLQLGAYFLLVEENFGVRPPHGFVVLDGSRFKVENTDDLRSEVLGIAESIRRRRFNLTGSIAVNKPAAQCRVCAQRSNCNQASRSAASGEFHPGRQRTTQNGDK